jgi:transposase-like protein
MEEKEEFILHFKSGKYTVSALAQMFEISRPLQFLRAWEVHGQRPCDQKCSSLHHLPLLSGKCNDPGSARELTHLNPSRL